MTLTSCLNVFRALVPSLLLAAGLALAPIAKSAIAPDSNILLVSEFVPLEQSATVVATIRDPDLRPTIYRFAMTGSETRWAPQPLNTSCNLVENVLICSRPIGSAVTSYSFEIPAPAYTEPQSLSTTFNVTCEYVEGDSECEGFTRTIFFEAGESASVSFNVDSEASSIRIAEGDLQEVPIVIERSGGLSLAVAVDLVVVEASATQSDVVLTPSAEAGTLNFAPGELSKTVFLRSEDDAITEGEEQLSLVLNNPRALSVPEGFTLDLDSNVFVEVVIEDNDLLGVSFGDTEGYRVSPGDELSIPITLSALPTQDLEFSLVAQTQAGDIIEADYSISPDTVLFSAEDTSLMQEITLSFATASEFALGELQLTAQTTSPLVNLVDRARSVSIQVQNGVSTPEQAALRFIGQEQASENQGDYRFDVELSNAVPGTYIFDVALQSQTALLGQDFEQPESTQITLNVAADGALSQQSFSVPIIDDDEREPDETFGIDITLAGFEFDLDTENSATPEPLVRLPDPITVTIFDNDDQPQEGDFVVELLGESTVEESAGEFILTLSRVDRLDAVLTALDVIITPITASADDLDTSTQMVRWPSQDFSDRTIAIPIVDNSLMEENRTFEISIRASELDLDTESAEQEFAFAPASLRVTILDDDRDQEQETPVLTEISGLGQAGQKVARRLDNICAKLLRRSNEDIQRESGDDGEQAGGRTALRRRCQTLFQNAQDQSGTLDEQEARRQQLRSTLRALSAQDIGAMGVSSSQFAKAQTSNISNRLSAIRAGSAGLDFGGVRLLTGSGSLSSNLFGDFVQSFMSPGVAAENAESSELFNDSRWGVFLNGNARYGENQTSDTQSGYDFDVLGLTLGADYRFSQELVLGLALGFADTDAELENGELESQNNSVSTYLSWYPTTAVYFDALASFGDTRYDNRRQVDDIRIQSETDGNELSFYLSGGYNYQFKAWQFGPTFRLGYSRVKIDGFSEQGQSGFEFVYSDQTQRSNLFDLGFQLSRPVNFSWGVLVPSFRASYVKEQEDDGSGLRVNFLYGLDDEGFTVDQELEDDSYYLIGAGLIGQFARGFSAFVDYESYQQLDGRKIEGVTAGGRWELAF